MSKILVAAGLGGTLPTLCCLGASYSVNPIQPSPATGVYLALILFFAIGMAVAYGFEESKVKRAFVLGIAAPGIVTSIFSGAVPAQVQASPSASRAPAVDGKRTALSSALTLLGLGEASAQESATASPATGDHTGAVTSELTTKLIINPSATSATWTNSAPVELKFLAKSGATINQLTVSSERPSTVIVPPGATAVEAQSAGKTTVAVLPGSAFASAVLNLHVTATPSNDFLWALGASRGATVRAISGGISDIKSSAAVPSATSRPLKQRADARVQASDCPSSHGSTRNGCAPKSAKPQ